MAHCWHHTLAGTFWGRRHRNRRPASRWVSSCTKFYYLVRRKREVRLHDGVRLRASVSPISSFCPGCRKQQKKEKLSVSQEKRTDGRTDVQPLHVSTPVTDSCGYRWAAHASECKIVPHAFPPTTFQSEIHSTTDALTTRRETLADVGWRTKQLDWGAEEMLRPWCQ